MFWGSLNGTWGTLVSSNPYNHGNTSFSQEETGLSRICRTHSRKAGLGVLESTPGFSQMIRTCLFTPCYGDISLYLKVTVINAA